MIRFGHYSNVSTVAEELDVDTLLEVIAEWEKKLYDMEGIPTAADAHFLLRQMVHDEIVRKDDPQYDFDAPFDVD